MTERRKTGSGTLSSLKKPTTLPVDYLRMVQEVFTTNFAEGLAILQAKGSKPLFEVNGEIYPDEIVLRASLLFEGQISATTAHASSDFDPTASSPKLEELLGLCVDALGAAFAYLLDPKDKERLEQLKSDSLAALEDVPFEWTKTEVNQRDIFIRVDKSNPKLDQMADDWLAQNDPEAQQRLESEVESSEDLLEARVQQIEDEKGRHGGGGSGPVFH